MHDNACNNSKLIIQLAIDITNLSVCIAYVVTACTYKVAIVYEFFTVGTYIYLQDM